MARTNSHSQSDRSRSGAELEVNVVRRLDQALERAKLDDEFAVLGRRHLDSPKLKPISYYLPGATVESFLRPDFAVLRRRDEAFVAFGGAKVSCKDRWIQDLHIARELKVLFPGSFWFECTAREHPEQTDDQIKDFIARRLAQAGSAFDAFCSQHVGDSMRDMEKRLIGHLRAMK